MKPLARWITAALAALHGLIHVLGVAKGFGIAVIDTLPTLIPVAVAWLWLASAVLLLAFAASVAARLPHWWAIGSLALIVSQFTIATSWSDARIGTVANLVLALPVLYGWLAHGPWSSEARYRRGAAAMVASATADAAPLVADADLAGLPDPVAAYLRRSGAVGGPRVRGFEARFRGRIRSDSHAAWMPFVARQTSTYRPHAARLFHMDATMRGLPVAVLHEFHEGHARMRGRLLSAVPVVNAAGPELDSSETVTIFNDLCVFAPAALLDAPVAWEQLDARRVRGCYTNAGITVSADLVFDDAGDLVDFVSPDRAAQTSGGATFVRMPWSTPLRPYRDWHGRRAAGGGEGRWHAPDGPFTYLELEVVDLRTF
ncbi:MAG: hypothetical protein LKI58_09120 [Actinomyces sp.]|jgi:hypothetical protein|nr:DUF6544 family protein [Actinomyces sp.]MCI1788212.1 hypothetical protein [Actinomyces sp.]MCI1830057.1 hypothetical protein [Actinomyces sp.]MCI1866496.1 hypothetical protein [Actinomyces sp.]